MNQPPETIIEFRRYYLMFKEFPDLQQELIHVNKKWIPFVDCWTDLQHSYERHLKFHSLEPQDRIELLKKRYFIDYYKKLNQDLKTLGYIGNYLIGKRCKGSLTNWI